GRNGASPGVSSHFDHSMAAKHEAPTSPVPFRPMKLASHTNRPAVSRTGNNHNRRIPSRSPSSVDVTTVVPSRTASVVANTNHHPEPPMSAYRPANGTPRTSQVKKYPTGLATRVFCSQYTW